MEFRLDQAVMPTLSVLVHRDSRRIARIRAVADFIRSVLDEARPLLQGRCAQKP